MLALSFVNEAIILLMSSEVIQYPLPTAAYDNQNPVANDLRKLATLQNRCAHLQEGCPIDIQRDNLSAAPLKKIKFKFKNQEATDS